LLQDTQRAEDFLRAAFEQMSAAQKAAGELAVDGEGETAPQLLWPVTPFLGVSATFHDVSYEERFGFRHDALDIPTAQGTPVLAAADGIVKDVSDHGLGFNSIVIKHAGGLVTLYGHIEKFSVAVGQHVSAGEVIGLSGGRPGTPGAGLSTGPHLHFGVYTAGEAVNPQPLLPDIMQAARSSEQ
jgi:murein DD-endopeptidase MepM/ murein hydrolase activator NlpD